MRTAARAGGPMLIGEPQPTRCQAGLEGLLAWRSSRLQWSRFLPLATMLAWAAWTASDRMHGLLVAMIVVAYGLIAQFRLWDDLVDRERDRDLYPQRVLAGTGDATSFVVTVWLLGAVNGFALYALNGWPALIGLLVLHGLLGLWYWRRAARGLVHEHVLLLKYPLFVLLLAPASSKPDLLALTSALVYAAMCAFELLDRGAGGRRQRAPLALHCVVLTVAALAVHTGWMSLAIALFAALLLATACLRHGLGRPLRGGMYVPFVAVAIVLFQLSRGA